MCKSSISKVDLSNGKFAYRAVPVEEKINCDFSEFAYKLIFSSNIQQGKNEFTEAIYNHSKLLLEIKSARNYYA